MKLDPKTLLPSWENAQSQAKNDILLVDNVIMIMNLGLIVVSRPLLTLHIR